MSTDSGLWLHTPHFSSVVSVFKVDARKPREGKWLSLVTQRLGGSTEPRYPEPLVQNSLSKTHLALRSEGPLELGAGHAFPGPSPGLHAGALAPQLLISSFPLLPALSRLRVLLLLSLYRVTHLQPGLHLPGG